MAISADVIPSRTSPPTVLLRRAWRFERHMRERLAAILSADGDREAAPRGSGHACRAGGSLRERASEEDAGRNAGP